MDFGPEGVEEATPYEVLLHAAMVGDRARFTRQDGVEEQWRIMQPLLDAPPPVHPYAPGPWGPRGGATGSWPATAAGTSPGCREDAALRRHHRRQRRRRGHARAPSRPVRAAHPLLERGDWLPREPQNWQAHDVFVDNRYISPDTWYDGDDKPFQPQVHYCVGGATKLYGAALYRLRQEDFGELRHHDGISPAWPIAYEELEPYYTLAEQRYEVHGARGEDPTTRRRRRRTRSRRSVTSRVSSSSPTTSRRGVAAVPRALRRAAGRGGHAGQPLRALRHLRRLPLSRARKSDAEVLGVRPALSTRTSR